jgi:hypothetical protein
MTWIFLAVLAVLVTGWAACRCRAWRAEARHDPGPRHPSRRALGGPGDGKPLSEEPGGEAEQLAALQYMIRHVSIPEPEISKKDGSPPGGRGQDQEEKR